ncbi:MAG TPA: molybdopterin converting factor subunit 1 [Gammaproteobacteria bacterium]|nr:molybdopterin converting factor subunit 1 [Gammaproteobacteria bacterium]
MIKVLYFAAVREAVGTAEEEVAAEGVATVADLLARLREADPIRAQALAEDRRLLVAVNQEYAEGSRPVADGDEVALFPPVTGG